MLDILPVRSPASGIKVLQMDLYDLKDHTKRYNTVLFMEAIEHVQKPDLAVELCYHTLSPGGILLFTTPWVSTWDKEADHVWRFDQPGVQELLTPYTSLIWSDDIFVYAVIEGPE